MPAFTAQSLQHTSLREQALHMLRAALIAGEIRPGEIHSAAALAAQLGISNSPVREAMLALVSEGLMEPVRNRGFRVVPVTDHDLDEIYELRLLLEVPPLAWIAEHPPADGWDRLDSLAAEIDAAAAAGDLPAFLEADRRFHLALLDLTGNRRLVDTVRLLREHTRLYGLVALAERGQLSSSASEHRELIALLTVGDAQGAQELMRRHLAHTRGIWASGTG